MALLTAQQLWDHHPAPSTPCDVSFFANQCAIRMGVALRGAGVNLSGFRGAMCFPRLKHKPRHVLRAQALADWLSTQPRVVGRVAKYKNVTASDFQGRNGLVFVRDGWGSTDHIDVWKGGAMKGGAPDYFARGKEVWFWTLL